MSNGEYYPGYGPAYTFPVQLKHDWPGLDSADDEWEMEPEEVVRIADELANEVDRLVDPGSALSKLAMPGGDIGPSATGPTGQTTEWWFGEWETGAQMKRGLEEARRLVWDAAQKLVEQMHYAVAEAKLDAADAMGEDEAAAIRMDTVLPDQGSPAGGPPVGPAPEQPVPPPIQA